MADIIFKCIYLRMCFSHGTITDIIGKLRSRYSMVPIINFEKYILLSILFNFLWKNQILVNVKDKGPLALQFLKFRMHPAPVGTFLHFQCTGAQHFELKDLKCKTLSQNPLN